MYRRILIISCLLFVAITQSGCIGLIINIPEECDDETLSTKIHDSFVATPPIKEERTPLGLKLSSEDRLKKSSKEEFLKEWGKPDEIISTSESVETWIYNRKLWCGAMPIIILPLPFILPVCDGFDRIEFRGNEAVRLHTRHITNEGFIIILPFFFLPGDVRYGDSACQYNYKKNVGPDAVIPPAQVTP